MSYFCRFSVVGVVEKMDDSLRVLEEYLPLFFRGISEYENVTENENSNQPCKANVSDHAKTILKEKFDENFENEFYRYAEERLELQKCSLDGWKDSLCSLKV